MFDKMVRFIIRTGKAHWWLKPLALIALVLLFGGAALVKWATSQSDRIRKTGGWILAALTQWRGNPLKQQTRRLSLPGPGIYRPSHRPTARAAAVAMSVCMVFTLMPSMAFAAEAETGLCEHHQAHTAECGYQEARPGLPCGHEHTADCYTDELICGLDGITTNTASGNDAVHTHTQNCYDPNCPHERGEHDGDCGYIEAVEGTPCRYVCAECGKPDKDSGSAGTTGGSHRPAPEEPKPEPVQPEGMEGIAVTAFDALDRGVKLQTVQAGTKLESLILPDTLGASGCSVSDDTDPVAEAITITGVMWEPTGENDTPATYEEGRKTPCSYYFRPVLPEGYTLAVGAKLPKIEVRYGWGTRANIADYDAGDLAVINAIIENNGLSATKDEPSSWTFAGWNNKTPKRVTLLSISSKSLTGTLDVSGLTYLTELSFRNNKLTGLTGLGSLTNLTQLNCGLNQLPELTGLGNLTNLTSLDCEANRLTELEGLGSLTNLTFLSCRVNQLTELTGLDSLTNLTSLYCDVNKLTGLTGLENLTKLDSLHCDNNKLTTLDVSTLTELKSLYCGNNKLTELTGLDSLTNLTSLSCGSNGLTELTGLDSLTNLTSLSCGSNGLAELTGLGSLTNLTSLSCGSNGLTELTGLDSLTNLTSLDCMSNQLESLDVSSLTKLTSLKCGSNGLTELTGLDSLTNLTSLDCMSNQLESLDVSSLTKLTSLKCSDNPLAFFKLPGTLELTVNRTEGGTTKLSGYTHSTKSITLKATPNSGYTFKEWTASSTTLGNAAKTPVTFTLDGQITITPVFESQTVIDSRAVAAARSVIEGGSYTVAQANAGTEDDLKTALAQQIHNLSGMSDTGITVTAGNITISSFNPATGGDADYPVGAGGSFSFTVALSKGTAADTTSSRTGTITATAFSGQTNVQAVAAARSVIEGGSYTVAQANAGTEDDLKAALAQQIHNLSGMSDTGITVTAGNITISSFNPATDGDADYPVGAGGSFSFTVALSKGAAADTTSSRTGTITATAFSGQTNGQAVAAARSVIEGGSYTMPQADAGTEDDLKTALAQQINALSGMSGTGITVTAGNITISSFTPAADGDAGDPDGTNGSFSFTVALSKGTAADTTSSKTGAVTAIPYASSGAALSSLSVTGATIIPAFSPATTSYTTSVGYGVSNVTITATAADSGVTVSGDTGVKALSVGSNTFTVTATNADGSHMSYTITITRAAYSGEDSSDDDNHSDSASDDGSRVTVQTPAMPDIPSIGTTPALTPDKDGSVSVKDDAVSAAISAAKQDARRKGSSESGVAVSVPVITTGEQSVLNVTIPAPTLDKLVGEQVTRFELTTSDMVSYSFSQDTLKQLDTNSAGLHIALRAEKQAELTGAAKAAVGSRPVYDITMIYLESGKEVPASTLNGKTINIKLPYTPTEGEDTGNLYAVYVDDAGEVQWLSNSTYDPNQKAILAQVSHFSVYGVGHKPAPAFTDTVDHWAKTDIDFVVNRDLLSGTSATTFSPNATITREIFVTALGRLAGIDPAAYPSSSRYTDVAPTAYYAPYVEWAASMGIIGGAGETVFSPDAAITREQMASIMQRYADKLGYILPAVREAEIFADEGQITSGMKNAVQAMQQAGVMNGKDGRRFGPKDTATRAESAAVLRRFVEIVIDPSTAQGWTQNDDGRFLYYQDGKPVTGWKQLEGRWYYFDAAGLMEYGGWKQIGGKWYYFFPDGAMAFNTKIDDYEIGSDGARKEE